MSRKSLINRLYIYSLQRFHPLEMVPLSLVFSTVALSDFSLKNLAFTSCLFLLVLLQTRLTDELKDFDHDKIYYPKRPVPSGLINFPELRKLLAVSISLQLYLVWLGKFSVFYYLFFQFYFFLMAKEFFVRNYLRKRFTLYIVLHEASAILLFLLLQTGGGFHTPHILEYVKSLFLTICLFTLEVARKFRKSAGGMDTYIENYGLSKTKRMVSFLFLIVGTISYFHLNNLAGLLLSVVFAVSVNIKYGLKYYKWSSIVGVFTILLSFFF